MSEADERLARGPKGDRGERGLSRIQGRSVVVLFLISVLFGGSGWYWTAHEIGVNNRKFCQVISDVVPVPKPADPAANPSRETSYVQYERAVRLGRSLGC